ncbi:PucR family transcriptional regulator [Streptomyces sp. GMY01]|uniref:PucR family transcriptional regulator n=2 Tax=unclassified Streptomyces TaxID=2593676 RepID=UPI00146B92D7|nr:PucR family transcriptional regulator [Streptomyces sp. GMY02]NMO36872.1 PucR family transcriptional regulator [Streptomyces sp. GMY02]
MDGGARGAGPLGGGAGTASLRALLSFDDGEAVRLLCAPAGADAAVGHVAVGFDDLGPGRGHALLLAVGAPAVPATVRRAARRGARAVVLAGVPAHEPGVRAELVAAAEETGVALLARAEGADWGQVAALLRSALAYAVAGRPGPDGGAAEVSEEVFSLTSLAAQVAARVGGSITIEDTRLRVLAHSATGEEADPLRRTTILGGRVPAWRVAELRHSGLLRALWTSPEVIHRPADADGPERLVVAVRGGREVLGSIWAAADGGALAPDAAAHLRAAAGLAAPLLVGERLRESGTARRRESALRGLLEGSGHRRTHAWSLGLSPDTACAVVVAERRAGAAGAAVADRALDVLALQAVALRPGTGVLRDGDRLVLLVVCDPPSSGGNGSPPAGRDGPGGRAGRDGRSRRRTPEGRGRGEKGRTGAAGTETENGEGEEDGTGGEAGEVLALVRELDLSAAAVAGAAPVWVGAGPVLPSVRAAESRERAELVVRALREREARAVAAGRPRPPRHSGPAGVDTTLEVLRVLDAARPVWESGAGPVHTFVRADAAEGGELLRTLAAFLDAGCDVPAAARRLVVHPNTLRYRLGRVRERYGIDLADPDTRLLVALAARLTAPPPV